MPTKSRAQSTRRDGRVKGETVKPDALKKLMELVGPAEVRRLIGVTETTQYRAMNQGVVSKVIEVAAAAAFKERSGAPSSGPAEAPSLESEDDEEIGLLILELPLKHEAKIATLAERLAGAKVVK